MAPKPATSSSSSSSSSASGAHGHSHAQPTTGSSSVVAGAWKWALVLLVAAVLVLQLRPEVLQLLNGNISPRGYLKDGNVSLVYFDLRGRGEAIRLLLEESGVAYHDQRINGETWSKIKTDPRLLFGQVPLLQDGDLSIVQSLAILKHIARVKGFYGQNYRERVMCDMVAGGAEDLRAKFYEVMYAPVELLDERKDKFLNETMPSWYQHFEDLLLNNGAMYGGGKHFVGRSLSYADVLVYDTIDITSRLNPSLLNEYPLLRAFKSSFEQRPAIREYQQTRRPTTIGGRHTHLYVTA